MKRLYIRSIQVELLNNLFEKVRKDEVSTDILDNGKQNKNLHKNFNQIFLTRKIGNFNIINMNLKEIFKIRNEKYDEIYLFHKQSGIGGLENIIILSYILSAKKIYHLKYNPNQLDLKNKEEIKKTIIIKYLIESILTTLLMPVGVLITCSIYSGII